MISIILLTMQDLKIRIRPCISKKDKIMEVAAISLKKSDFLKLDYFDLGPAFLDENGKGFYVKKEEYFKALNFIENNKPENLYQGMVAEEVFLWKVSTIIAEKIN